LTKYSITTATSAIIKCPGCNLHDVQHLAEANQRAYHNFRLPLICIFKQSEVAAHLLQIKAHQPYKDLTLLRYHLQDILPQLKFTTNILPLQDQLQTSHTADIDDSSRLNNSFSPRPSLVNLVVELIEQLVDSKILSHNLTSLASTLSLE